MVSGWTARLTERPLGAVTHGAAFPISLRAASLGSARLCEHQRVTVLSSFLGPRGAERWHRTGSGMSWEPLRVLVLEKRAARKLKRHMSTRDRREWNLPRLVGTAFSPQHGTMPENPLHLCNGPSCGSST